MAADSSAEGPFTGGSPVAGEPSETFSSDEAHAALAELDQELSRLQRSIRRAIQAKLGQLAGRSLGSLQHNRELARSIHDLLDSHGLRVRCNECGHPAILRVSPRRGSPAGAFVFDHTIAGRRTFHGGRGALPELRLVAKPARGKSARGKPERAAG